MSSQEIKLRCFAERNPAGQWEAYCIDVNLAVQGDSLSEVHDKLEAAMQSYLADAAGVDREHAKELLNRAAPLSLRLRYYLVAIKSFRDRIVQWVRAHGRDYASDHARPEQQRPLNYEINSRKVAAPG